MGRGRLEHQLKVNQKIQNRLKTLPQIVTGFYNTFNEDQFYTAYTYVCAVGQFLEYVDSQYHISHSELSKVTMDEINGYIKHISYKEKNGQIVNTSTSHQATTWTILNNFFEYLLACDMIIKNPLDKTKRPRVRDKVKKVSMNAVELNTVIKTSSKGVGSHKAQAFQATWRERDVAIVLLLSCTGMRINALDQINLADLDLVHNTLTVTEKGMVERIYDLNKITMKAIMEWLMKRDELLYGEYVEALFISNRRTRMSITALSLIVEKYSSTITKHITPHKFRSTFINLGYAATGDIYKIQQAVGHQDIGTTLRYLEEDNSAAKEISNVVGDLIHLSLV